MTDSDQVPATAQWMYQGVWRVLTQVFRVPRQPPSLPSLAGERLTSFRPSPQWLRYLLVQYWISWSFLGLLVLSFVVVLLVAVPLVGVLLVMPIAFLFLVPVVLTHLSLHLQYDTTWYVLNPRSLRLRRGIWTIHESTITFENVQNVSVSQGPLQRFFGIADVVVQTAGGGGPVAGPHGGGAHGGHVGLLEGLSNAEEVRNIILGKLRHSTSAGLGDDDLDRHDSAQSFTYVDLALLREIRDAASRLARSREGFTPSS